MSRRILIRPKAVQDVTELLDWLHERSPATAAAWKDELKLVLASLADTPLIGQEHSGGRVQCRRWVWRTHTVFYDVTDTEIEVIRILHQRQDARRALGRR